MTVVLTKRLKYLPTQALPRQRGIATLVVSVILMLASFGIAYFTSEIVINDARIYSNKQRADKAFQAAQAGLEYGKAMLVSPCDKSETFVDGSHFDVSCQTISDIIYITSVGYSDDDSVKRTLQFAVAQNPGTSSPPNVPIVSRGGVSRNGGIKAVNNAESLTIWAGGSIDVNNSSTSTYISLDGNDNWLSSNRSGSTKLYGPDIVENDPNLANATKDEVMLSFFNKTMDDYKAIGQNLTGSVELSQTSSGVYYSDSGLTLSGSAKTTLDPSRYTDWETDNGDIESNLNMLVSTLAGKPVSGSNVNNFTTSTHTYIGSPDSPVTIVVNGTVELPTNLVLFGIIVADKITSSGNATVVGGVIALSSDADAVDFGGSVDVVMDTSVVGNTGAGGGFGPVLGSWRDW